MNKEAFGKLVIDAQESLYRVAKSILYSDEDCKDAISEAITKGFEKLDTLKKDKFAKTWLTRILINECYDILRYGSIMLVKEDENSYEIYDGLSQLARETEYDVAYPSYYDNVPEEIYFYNGNDVWEKNHFESIQAGETRTASYCFVVREDWLPYMYFDITGADYPDQFEKTVIKTGLIDIRQ